MLVRVLFLDYIPVKSKYVLKNNISHALFYNVLLHITQILFSYQAWVVYLVFINNCMKNDVRYGCGFHTTKNNKIIFSSKRGRFENSYL